MGPILARGALMTWHLLIDTCTWLDLGKDHRKRPLVAALEHLVKNGAVADLIQKDDG
jgi:hypothetical protein